MTATVKIISVDNRDKDDSEDVLIADNITVVIYADDMVRALNKLYSGPHAPRFFLVVDSDYKLKTFSGY